MKFIEKYMAINQILIFRYKELDLQLKVTLKRFSLKIPRKNIMRIHILVIKMEGPQQRRYKIKSNNKKININLWLIKKF
jgi:hypothetical protein